MGLTIVIEKQKCRCQRQVGHERAEDGQPAQEQQGAAGQEGVLEHQCLQRHRPRGGHVEYADGDRLGRHDWRQQPAHRADQPVDGHAHPLAE